MNEEDSDEIQWKNIVKDGVDPALGVKGEDVIIAMHYAGEPTKSILYAGFTALFGMHPDEWTSAPEIRTTKVLNRGVFLVYAHTAIHVLSTSQMAFPLSTTHIFSTLAAFRIRPLMLDS